MNRDPLGALGRLRRFEVDMARRELAAGLQAATKARAVQQAADAAIAHEAVVATDPATNAAVAAAFAGWQPRGRRLSDAARVAQETAEQETIRARAVVAAARAAAEVVEVMQAELMRAGRVVALRAEQVMLDDHGGWVRCARPSAQ